MSEALKLSLLMPAKDSALFLEDAVASLAAAREVDWELIVVEDHSSDNTWQTLQSLAERDERIRPSRNPGRGKVQALNHAYSQATGTVITTLDADDALDPGYFSYLRDLPEGTDAFVRDYIVVDNSLRRIGTYRMSNDLLAASFLEVVSGLISLPRATWTVRRPVAEKVFPIPTGLPFEDVWFSLTIKRFALRIENPRREMYYYRQHDGQTFGGVLNYHPEKTRFRARRLYAYATLLPTHVARLEIDALPDMGNTQVFYSLMSQENLPLLSILRADLCPRSKAKLLLFRKLWFLVAIAKRVQWKLESGRARDNQ